MPFNVIKIGNNLHFAPNSRKFAIVSIDPLSIPSSDMWIRWNAMMIRLYVYCRLYIGKFRIFPQEKMFVIMGDFNLNFTLYF